MMRPPIATLVLLLLGLLGASGPAARAEDPPTNTTRSGAASSSAPTLESFRIIFDRNIFNPNRTGRTPEREYSPRRETDRRIRTESFALVGTMSYERGRFAFFDGTSSDYKKVLQETETIAGFTVASVAPQQVVLRPIPRSSSNESTTNATITNTITTTTDGTNAATAAETKTTTESTNGVTATTTNSDSSTTNADIVLPVGMQLQRRDEGRWEVAARNIPGATRPSSVSPVGSTSSGGNDEVLKRLMQQRDQESSSTGAPPASASPSSAETPASTVNRSQPTSAPPAGEDDVLKRLMQRREQENK